MLILASRAMAFSSSSTRGTGSGKRQVAAPAQSLGPVPGGADTGAGIGTSGPDPWFAGRWGWAEAGLSF